MARSSRSRKKSVPFPKLTGGRQEPLDGAIYDKIEIKVFILFLLDELNYPMEYSALSYIMEESGYIGRFDFTAAFSELTELGHILETEKNGEKVYVVSDLGRNVAAALGGDLPDTIREKSRATALRLLSLHQRGAKCHSEITKREDGKFLVRCVIEEKGGIMADTTVVTSSETEAQTVKQHFAEKPEEVYRGILTVLTGTLDYYLH